MSTNYPSGIDTNGTGGTLNVQAGTTPLATGHVSSHQNLTDSVIALETKVGVDASAVTTTIDYKLKSTSSIDPGHKHTNTSVTLALDDLSDVVITTPINGNGLTYNGSNWINSTTSVADASTTVKGVTELNVAPASPTVPIAIGSNNTKSGTIASGSNKVEDEADTSATSSAGKLVRMDANGKVAEGATYFDYQAFTSGGTWTKPTGLTGNENVYVQVWGGGGAGGGVPSAGNVGGGGGGGGAFIDASFKAADLGSTVTVTIGAAVSGTTTSGGAGNTSSFGTLAVSGGGGGAVGVNNTDSGAGGGGGIYTAGSSSTSSTGGAGGDPVGGAAATNSAGFGGGGGGGTGGTGGGKSVYGGGGGGSCGSGSSGTVGGASIKGGGGGGGGGSSSSGAAGASMLGGAGGAGATNGNGSAGVAPGGGGGGAGGGGAVTHTGGGGARGECRVWVLI